MMNRRQLMYYAGVGSAYSVISAEKALARAEASAAAEPDPILAAIDAHQRAYDAWQAVDEDYPNLNALDTAEQQTWERLCNTPPTTLFGLARMTSYIQRHRTRGTYPSDESIDAAWVSIATSAATFAAKRRAA